MRKRLLGTIAAVTAGAGSALGQGAVPPPPAAIGPVRGVQPASDVVPAMGYYADPITSPVGQPTGLSGAAAGPMVPPGMVDPSMAGGPGMNGFPGYPAGLHGDQHWQSPDIKTDFDRTIAPKFWLNANYLMWFAKAQPTNFPLVTTSAPNDGGQLGAPTTTVLHSRTDLGYNLFSGFKIDGGLFCDDCRRSGIYASGFMTEQKANVFYAASDATGQPLLARPFFNVATAKPDVLLVSFPTFAQGSVLVYSRSRIWGAEGGPITNVFRSEPGSGSLWNVNAMAAFRYLELDENLETTQNSTLLGSFTAPFDGKQYSAPARITVLDSFTVQNQFYGGQVGMSADTIRGRWQMGVTGKFAMGVMHERITVNGLSSLVDSTRGISSQVVGGLFANSSNIGTYKHDEFSVIPEVTATLGYAWTSRLSSSIGYNFLYVSKVARPGAQYSPAVNPGIIPTSPSYGFSSAIPTPNNLFTQSDYWIQGVNFCTTFRY